MDFGYILQNSIVYGYISLILASIFAFKRYMNFAIWWIFILFSYFIYNFIENWLDYNTIIIFFSIIIIYFWIDFFIYNSFNNPKKRELFSVVFSLWLLIFIENILSFFEGWSVISLSDNSIPTNVLIITFICLNIIIFYLLKYSLFWKTCKWIYENYSIIKSFWINISKFLFPYFLFLLFVWFFVSYINLTNNTMKPIDWIFYLLKGVWIMVLVWITKIEYSFIWALIYVIFEYILFISLWVEITYKESLILLIILIILLFK